MAGKVGMLRRGEVAVQHVTGEALGMHDLAHHDLAIEHVLHVAHHGGGRLDFALFDELLHRGQVLREARQEVTQKSGVFDREAVVRHRPGDGVNGPFDYFVGVGQTLGDPRAPAEIQMRAGHDEDLFRQRYFIQRDHGCFADAVHLCRPCLDCHEISFLLLLLL